jgi:putative transposase
VLGIYFYLYLFVDLFSRKIVGWQVYDCESAELASQLLQAICESQAITPNQLTVHCDNGSPMKGETMACCRRAAGRLIWCTGRTRNIAIAPFGL